MMREIGSDFWENKQTENRKPFVISGVQRPTEEQYFISGRSAIRAFARYVKTGNKNILLPAFTCETVITPFKKEGWDIYYYPIHLDLIPNYDAMKKLIMEKSPTVIYLQSYFGFHTLTDVEEIITICKEKNITLIEDLTQCLFSDFEKTKADYHVASLRKYISIPEGGILLAHGYTVEGQILPPEKAVIHTAQEAFWDKKLYIEGSTEISKERFLNAYKKWKRLIGEFDDVYQINEESKKILEYVDVDYMKKKRRDNYSYLWYEIQHISWVYSVFSLPDIDEVPLYFPVYIKAAEERKRIQQYLAERDIYCPIVWPQYMEDREIDEESKYIYEHILCIPCDQRYRRKEMLRIIEEIKNI